MSLSPPELGVSMLQFWSQCSCASSPGHSSKVLTLLMWIGKALEEDGKGRVLVVDGGASMRCALLGDNIAEMGHKNGWSVSCLVFDNSSSMCSG